MTVLQPPTTLLLTLPPFLQPLIPILLLSNSCTMCVQLMYIIWAQGVMGWLSWDGCPIQKGGGWVN